MKREKPCPCFLPLPPQRCLSLKESCIIPHFTGKAIFGARILLPLACVYALLLSLQKTPPRTTRFQGLKQQEHLLFSLFVASPSSLDARKCYLLRQSKHLILCSGEKSHDSTSSFWHMKGIRRNEREKTLHCCLLGVALK